MAELPVLIKAELMEHFDEKVGSTNPSHQSARVGASIHSRWVRTLRIDSGDDVADIVARLNAA